MTQGPSRRCEELADILLYLTALAQMQGIDLQSEVEEKIKKNRGLSTPQP
nr:MazG-like family protein [Streptomyces sp. MNP-20]